MSGVERRERPTASCEDLLRTARERADEGGSREALGLCDEAIRRCPKQADGWRLRGSIRLAENDPGALDDFVRVTKLRPSCSRCWFELAWGYLRLGHIDEALEPLDQSLSLEPDAHQVLSSRALVLSRLRRDEEALRDISRAAELEPSNESHQHNLGVTLTALGRHREAIEVYRRLIALHPKSAGTHNNLAWLLATTEDATLRDGPRAVFHAQQAISEADNPAWMDTLAAALAESGDFDAAVEVEDRAYALSRPRNDSFRARSALYRKKVSYAAWHRERSIHDKRIP